MTKPSDPLVVKTNSFFTRFSAFCKSHAVFLALALGLVVLRNGMVVFDMWTLLEGGDLPEGLLHGNFAFDILDNTWRGWPAYLYRVRGHLGNELLVGVMAIPLYLLFGNSLFVLCQVTIIYSLGILSFVYYICHRWLEKKIAVIAAILFVCAPVIIQGWAVYPYGLHLESAFFSLFAMMLFLSIIESGSSRNRILLSMALGVVSGIGLFHSAIHLLCLGCILLFWLIKDTAIYKKREFLYFLLSLSVAMLPYLYLGPGAIISFIQNFLAGDFSHTLSSGMETHSYLTTLKLMSILFWPVNNLLYSRFSDVVVTIIGAAVVLLLVLTFKKSLLKKNLLVQILLLYCGLYLLITLVKQVAVQYYFFPIYPHIIVILAICLGKLQTRYFNRRRFYKVFFYFVLFSICIPNVYEIVKHFEPSAFASQLKKQLAINGCCFYWPGEYFAPSGLKTEIAFEVEKFALQTRFMEIPKKNDLPRKTIFVSNIRTAAFPLASPQSYLVYGKDVSFAGLAQLADEIESNVPESAKPYAYKGLAVYYVNDNWLADLLLDYKAGMIKDKIPPSYQRYFYGELARKIYNKYAGDPQTIKRTFDMFSGQERQWMLKTKVPFRAIIDDLRISYRKIDFSP